MSEEQSRYKASAKDILNEEIIRRVFSCFDKAGDKFETLDNNTYLTRFIRSVYLAKSMLWKYTPSEIRTSINTMYHELDVELKNIEASSLSQSNKKINKTIIADEVSFKVLELLFVVLQYSPLSTEFAEMEIFGDMQDLIKNIRSNRPVKLFSGELRYESSD